MKSFKQFTNNITESFKRYEDESCHTWSSEEVSFGLKQGYTPAAAIGNYKGKNSVDMVLFKLNSYDAKEVQEVQEVQDVKLKTGEHIFRYVSRGTMIGGMMPYIKVNLDKGIAFRLTKPSFDGETEKPEFESKGVKQSYVRVVKGAI